MLEVAGGLSSERADARARRRGAVSTSFSCVEGDGGPGIASCLDESGGGSGGQLDTSTPGQHTYAVTPTSLDGFTQDASVSYTVAAVPGATIMTPASGAVYGVGQSVSTSFSCVDGAGGPGIASCLDQSGGGSGGQLDTSTPGQRTYAVTATSLDGFTHDASVSYTVAAVPGTTTTTPASGPVHAIGPPVPDNHHQVFTIRGRRNGTVTFSVTVPGPGRIDVLVTGGTTISPERRSCCLRRRTGSRSRVRTGWFRERGHSK